MISEKCLLESITKKSRIEPIVDTFAHCGMQ